jgi:hypothetical protein
LLMSTSNKCGDVMGDLSMPVSADPVPAGLSSSDPRDDPDWSCPVAPAPRYGIDLTTWFVRFGFAIWVARTATTMAHETLS